MKRPRRQQHDASDSLASIPWYWRDWRASKARAVLSLEARAVYRELMDAQWAEADCALSPDDESLAALAAVPMETWLRVRAQVLAFFDTDRDGKLINPRMRFEWKKARSLRKARRVSAKEAANARWEKEKTAKTKVCETHAPRIADAMRNDALRHPSSVIRQPSPFKEPTEKAAVAASVRKKRSGSEPTYPAWTVEAGRIWEGRNGAGSWTKARAVRFNGAVAKAVSQYGHERVLPTWRWYANRKVEHNEYLTPENFAGHYLEWERKSGTREEAESAATAALAAVPQTPATSEATEEWASITADLVARSLPVVTEILPQTHGHRHEGGRLVVRVPGAATAKILRGHPKLADLWDRVILEVAS